MIFRNAAQYSANCVVMYGENKIYMTQSNKRKLYAGFTFGN